MENKLSRLFDYQKFESNPDLEKVIRGVEEKYSLNKQALSDDDLEFVAAAGDLYIKRSLEEDET
ncbi:hypothetical protein [Butyrivibrio sp.]|jgi:hypothetical protein|uniref:hypothetical protein n=1 Tax=Butyrivibrio sp. TaxID=28121 RepID=UPI0025BC5B3F|nr:hypothetical protein [Butyrivibrio sp.]MBE5838540.1 hypothetical protein [Butyrivibrio sp.]